jgi:hypothetical protein
VIVEHGGPLLGGVVILGEDDLDAFLELGKPELYALGRTEPGAESEENEEGAHLGKIGRSEAGARSIGRSELGGRGGLEAFDLERI